MLERRDKINYYLDLAEIVGQRGTCLRRHYGAVIVKNDEVISTGYVGAPRGRKNCSDLGICIRQKMNVPRGERYELCRSVHAEANAIISASRGKMIGSTLYLVGKEVDTGEYVKNSNSCSMCKPYFRQSSRCAGCRSIHYRKSGKICDQTRRCVSNGCDPGDFCTVKLLQVYILLKMQKNKKWQ